MQLIASTVRSTRPSVRDSNAWDLRGLPGNKLSCLCSRTFATGALKMNVNSTETEVP